MRLTKAQLTQLAYGLSGIVVVLLVILVLTAREHQRELTLRDDQLATERRATEEKIQQVLSNVQATDRYKKYCTPSIQRIDSGDEWLKLVYRTPQRYDLFMRDEKKVWCVPGATASSSDCTNANTASFTTVYVCPEREVSSFVVDKNAVQISAQPAGAAVVVDHVVLEQNGFVLVRAVDARNKPSDILSTSMLLTPGGYDLVSIPIPQPLRVGLRYVITLAVDTNTNGVYDQGSDADIMDDSGQTATALFRAVKE